MSDDRLWLRLQLRLDLFVGEWRLFTYEELGFVDAGASNREIGDARPHVALLVEKSSLQRIARLVARRFGVSLLILGGVPTWIGTEFFCRELRARVSTPLLLVSFCDFDPYGWRFPKDFARQVQRYGMSIQRILRLVTPSCFTEEEIRRYACDLPASPNQRKQVEEWLQESGGINGETKGLYADYLRPAERVFAAFERETGLSAVLP